MYNGERVPYKGVTKNGKFVAIVSRKYTLVPNEKVEEKLMYLGKRIARAVTEGWQQYWFIPDEVALDPEYGILVGNSVDASQSLRIYAVVSRFKINRFEWIYAVWGYRRAEKLYGQVAKQLGHDRIRHLSQAKLKTPCFCKRSSAVE